MVVYQIIAVEKLLQQDMYYKNKIIMKYTIKYPELSSDSCQGLLNKLNSLYRIKALMYERSNIMNLYQMAIVEFEYAAENKVPFHPFEANADFVITYNQNLTLSLYFDQYEYAGGAHGLIYRCSDTWDVKKGKKIELNELLPARKYFKEYMIQNILQYMDYAAIQEEYPYFNDYYNLVRKYFKKNQFYLTIDGIIQYYQQYEIAPYSFGIPTFLVLFSSEGAVEPKISIPIKIEMKGKH